MKHIYHTNKEIKVSHRLKTNIEENNGKFSNKAYYKNKDNNVGIFKDILNERFKLQFTIITKNDLLLYLLSYLCCQRENNNPWAQQKDRNKVGQSLKTLGSTYIYREFSGCHMKTNLAAQCQYQKQYSTLET